MSFNMNRFTQTGPFQRTTCAIALTSHRSSDRSRLAKQGGLELYQCIRCFGMMSKLFGIANQLVYRDLVSPSPKRDPSEMCSFLHAYFSVYRLSVHCFPICKHVLMLMIPQSEGDRLNPQELTAELTTFQATRLRENTYQFQTNPVLSQFLLESCRIHSGHQSIEDDIVEGNLLLKTVPLIDNDKIFTYSMIYGADILQ